MLKVDTYSVKGTKLDTSVSIPTVEENMSLLAQAVHVYRNRAHVGRAKTKTRADINRTTKKVYKQKGTGGARHGSRRAPIYVGGGVAHGRKAERKVLSLSQKMRRRALDVAFVLKAKNKDMIAVNGFDTIKKTKDGQVLVNKLGITGRKVIVLSDKNSSAIKPLSNLANAKVVVLKDLNAYDVVFGGKLLMDASIFAKTESTTKTKKETVKPVAKKTTKGGKTK